LRGSGNGQTVEIRGRQGFGDEKDDDDDDDDAASKRIGTRTKRDKHTQHPIVKQRSQWEG
jgi:hypothetical protein